jgi:hypothetical protein
MATGHIQPLLVWVSDRRVLALCVRKVHMYRRFYIHTSQLGIELPMELIIWPLSLVWLCIFFVCMPVGHVVWSTVCWRIRCLFSNGCIPIDLAPNSCMHVTEAHVPDTIIILKVAFAGLSKVIRRLSGDN